MEEHEEKVKNGRIKVHLALGLLLWNSLGWILLKYLNIISELGSAENYHPFYTSIFHYHT